MSFPIQITIHPRPTGILPLSTRERREMARAIALETLMRSMEPREARVVGSHRDVLDSEEACRTGCGTLGGW